MSEPIERTILEQLKRLEKGSGDLEPEKKEKVNDSFESLELDFRCLVTKRDFIVLFERRPPDPVYRVVRIAEKDRMSHPGSDSPCAAEALDINLHEIEYDKVDCPYCGGRAEVGTFIRCGKCGMLSCAGGLRKHKGKYHHTCPWCGAEGYVQVVETGKVTGKTGKREETRPGEDAGNLLPPT